jgi:transposase InsO family protein
MKEAGLRGRMRRRFRKTTDSNHPFPIAPNVLERDFSATAPNQSWVTDITYLWTREGWLYLAVMLDLFSRRVVSWATSATIDRHLALAALQTAVRTRRPDAGLVHHSDRGSTYASGDYRAALDTHAIECSMSRKGDCWDSERRASSRRSSGKSRRSTTWAATTRRTRSSPTTLTASTTSSDATRRSATAVPWNLN